MNRLYTVIIILFSTVLQLSAQQKNILFIAVDDLKPVLNCYNESQIISPNIDNLASEGVLFENAYCQWSVCGPSRASLLTGMTPDGSGVRNLTTQMRDVNPNIITLPQFFKNNGYATAASGKIFDNRNVDDGHDLASWTFDYSTSYAYKSRYPATPFVDGSHRVLANTASEEGPEGVDYDGYQDGQIYLDALDYLNEFAATPNKPFFLAVGFKKPHIPFIAPKKYWDLYERESLELAPFQKPAVGSPDYVYYKPEPNPDSYVDIPDTWDYNDVNDILDEDSQRKLIHGYFACVSYVDDLVGKLTSRLEELGLAENTIIVLWGDHGYHLGDHNQWGKHTNFENAVHMPLIISAPNGSSGRSNQPVELIDLYPTIVDLAGFEVPLSLQGDVLSPIIDNKDINKTCAVSEYRSDGHAGYSFRTEKYRFSIWCNDSDNRPDLIEWSDDIIFDVELYDYVNDPLETVNVYTNASYQNVVDSMMSIAENWWNEQYLFLKTRINPKYVKEYNYLTNNSDFEDGIDIGWETTSDGNFIAQFTNSTDSYIGANSLAIAVSTTGNNYNDAIVKSPIYQCLSGLRVDNVSVSAFAKSTDINDNLKFILEVTHFNGDVELFESSILTLSNDYDSIGYKVGIPESTATWQLSILCGTAQGNLNIDNVKLSITENDYTSIRNSEYVVPKLYPNPVKDILYIPEFFSDNSIISIYNISGKLVKSLQATNSEVSLFDINNGIYIVGIRDEKNYNRQKIVVSK